MPSSILFTLPTQDFAKSDIGFKFLAESAIIVESYRILEYIVEKGGYDVSRVTSYHLDYDWFCVQVNGKRIAVAVSQGASMAVDLAERYRDSGAKKIVRIGTAGKLSGPMELGDVVLPFAAIRDEGTSKFYQSIQAPALADIPLTLALSASIREAGAAVHNGIIWSTDGRWRETDALISQRIADGAIATDMESSAVYSFGQFYKLRTSSVSVISDEIVHGDDNDLRGLSDEDLWFGMVLPRLLLAFNAVATELVI
jgi:uridine phosphorylase